MKKLGGEVLKVNQKMPAGCGNQQTTLKSCASNLKSIENKIDHLLTWTEFEDGKAINGTGIKKLLKDAASTVKESATSLAEVKAHLKSKA